MFFKLSWPRLRRWELTLLLGLATALLLGLWLEREQSDLADSVLRLHVLANSDSETDQALKLKVRDRVLAEAELILPDGASLEVAERKIGEKLSRLAARGRGGGGAGGVRLLCRRQPGGDLVSDQGV